MHSSNVFKRVAESSPDSQNRLFLYPPSIMRLKKMSMMRLRRQRQNNDLYSDKRMSMMRLKRMYEASQPDDTFEENDTSSV